MLLRGRVVHPHATEPTDPNTDHVRIAQKANFSKGRVSEKDDFNLPTKIMIRLQIKDDPLIKYEDTRSHSKVATLSNQGWKAAYLVEIEIGNIKNLVLYKEPKESNSQFSISIYLSVHMPCKVLKVYPQKEHKPQEVRSVFRYPSAPLINAWNMHQTFFLEG